MSKRKNRPLFAVITNEDGLAAAANRYVELHLDYNAKKAAHEKRIAELNAAVDAETATPVSEINSPAARAQLYCEQPRELSPDDQRSRQFRNARVGFRWNPYKVEKRLSKDTWEAIGERLAELPWGERYVTYKSPVVNKELLLNHRAVITEAEQRQAGIEFAKAETFFIDPAFDSVEGVSKEAA